MAKRGRQSSASIVSARGVALSAEKRVSPPLHLSDAEIAVWNELVNDQPASAFTDTHKPIIEMYCRHVVNSRVIADQILAFEIEWMNDDEGLKRYDKLLAMSQRESSQASALARSLRITRQSIDQQTVARALNNHVKSRKPWELTETIEQE